MRLGYRWLRRSPRIGLKQCVIALGALLAPVSICSDSYADGLAAVAKPAPFELSLTTPRPIDPRVLRLRAFFAKLHCPVQTLAADFVVAADKNQLDWRLLPSISVIESGGGKNYRNNNIFGWDQGVGVFASLRAGIQEVADHLAHSRIYRNRPVIDKLHLYNHNQDYATSVMAVMNRISPARANF